jgi:alkane 1-monooxygenase
MKKLKYLSVFSLPVTVWISFHSSGWVTFLPAFVFFLLIPLLEVFLKPNEHNLSQQEKEIASKDSFYDILLYVMFPVQWFFVFYFLFHVTEWNNKVELIGRTGAMATMCGVIGINLGHELGHRLKRWEQLFGEALLFSSLENHFLPYHNRGHHTNVGTPYDPATARRNEPLFVFWFRSHFGSYFQAWQIEFQRMRILKLPLFHWSNRMVVYTILHLIWLVSIYYFFGGKALYFYLWAAGIGILLLETVNYIEHYGLMRRKRENGTYEVVKRWHSWNSNHVIGRVVLFELSRHSDHHFKADRPYQLLESHEDSPVMPTGYPGMMLLSLFPPLFFYVVNPIIDREMDKHYEQYS